MRRGKFWEPDPMREKKAKIKRERRRERNLTMMYGFVPTGIDDLDENALSWADYSNRNQVPVD